MLSIKRNYFPTFETTSTDVSLSTLTEIQDRVLWLATNMIHHANYVRPNPDGTKVGGHQASSASMVTIMTALYFHYLRYGDLVSVKPHASPVFHAIQYLLGEISRDYLPTLRAYKGLQAYPSRTKDPDKVDFSTGSVGLGAVAPAFAALTANYVKEHFGKQPDRRFVAIIGDAELDEGNIWEALLDDATMNLGNLMLIVDLNRQSLDRVIPGIKANRLKQMFASCGWQVLEAKYGHKLQRLAKTKAGAMILKKIDEMDNLDYQRLLNLDGADLRARFCAGDAEVEAALAHVSDADLPGLIGNLAGHDFEELLARFAEADSDKDRPTVLFAYTIKGWRLPIAGDPGNHSMLLSPDQLAALRDKLKIGPDEWADFSVQSPIGQWCQARAEELYPTYAPQKKRVKLMVPSSINFADKGKLSTQQSFGRIMQELSRLPTVTERIVTVSPDVSSSTNLAGWINKMGVFAQHGLSRRLANGWREHLQGQHIELGISEMNLFMLLGMLGISAELIDEPLIPIGTVYDPFVCRGLDAFIYALYSGAKFIIAGTPSGVTLSPEGGAHQSTVTASLGMELPNLRYFEPTYAGELSWIMLDCIAACADREHGAASYLRLSTKPIDQKPFQAAKERIGADTLRGQVLSGGYRLLDWKSQKAGDLSNLVHLVTTGAMTPDVLAAATQLQDQGRAVNVINLTSSRKLFEAWKANAHGLDWLVPNAERNAPMVIVNDGASHAHAWIGSALGMRIKTLGVDTFGQSGTRADLYAHMGIDANTIVSAVNTF